MSVKSHRISQRKWATRNPTYQKEWSIKKYGVKLPRGVCNRVHGEGYPATIEYSRYADMKRRCYNVNRHNYPYYGGRGIKVCARWLLPKGQGYLNFLEDMGRTPDKSFTLDRIDNDGDYEPDNCRWTTKAVQATNRRKRRV